MPDITHTAVGWTRYGAWPAGFRPFHHGIRVGTGEVDFRRLAEGILTPRPGPPSEAPSSWVSESVICG
jgi:uncharacterized protein (UPF0548 family)